MILSRALLRGFVTATGIVRRFVSKLKSRADDTGHFHRTACAVSRLSSHSRPSRCPFRLSNDPPHKARFHHTAHRPRKYPHDYPRCVECQLPNHCANQQGVDRETEMGRMGEICPGDLDLGRRYYRYVGQNEIRHLKLISSLDRLLPLGSPRGRGSRAHQGRFQIPLRLAIHASHYQILQLYCEYPREAQRADYSFQPHS